MKIFSRITIATLFLLLASCSYSSFVFNPDLNFEFNNHIYNKDFNIEVQSDVAKNRILGYVGLRKLKLSTETSDKGVIFYNSSLDRNLGNALISEFEKKGMRYDTTSDMKIVLTIKKLSYKSSFGKVPEIKSNIELSVLKKDKMIYQSSVSKTSSATWFIWAFSNKSIQKRINASVSQALMSSISQLVNDKKFVYIITSK